MLTYLMPIVGKKRVMFRDVVLLTPYRCHEKETPHMSFSFSDRTGFKKEKDSSF